MRNSYTVPGQLPIITHTIVNDADMSDAKLILASASPRRHELLLQLGLDPLVLTLDLDETQQESEGWRSYVQRIALEKAKAGFNLSDSKLPVLGADTCVVVDDLILGKPDSPEIAKSMLRMLSGRSHQVATAVALALPDGSYLQALNLSRVCFAHMPDAFICSYVASGDAMDKAGAYAIQGWPAAFIESLEGSYSGVMGLPLYETASLLQRAGVLWYEAFNHSQ